jgi:signal transduction histidine kinase
MIKYFKSYFAVLLFLCITAFSEEIRIDKVQFRQPQEPLDFIAVADSMAEWNTVHLPHLFNSSKSPHLGLYKFDFFLNEIPDYSLGLNLSYILSSDVVYLNGKEIGSNGSIGKNFVDAPKSIRIHKLPSNILQIGTNSILVVVQSSSIKGGLAVKFIEINDYKKLHASAFESNFKHIIIESIIVGLLIMAIIVWFLLYEFRDSRGYYTALGILMIIASGIFIFESNLFFTLNLLNPATQKILISLYIIAIVPLLHFAFNTSLRIERILQRTIGLASIISSIIFLFFGTLSLCIKLETILLTMLAVILVAIFIQVWRAKDKSQAMFSKIVAYCIIWSGICIYVDYVLVVHFARCNLYGLFTYLGFVGFISAIPISISTRLKSLKKSVQILSSQIIDSQENQQKIFAARLHNDIAPMLATIKLDSQILFRKLGNPKAKNKIVEELQNAIDTVRELSHDMRPTAVDQFGLSAATKILSEKYAEQHNWQLLLELPADDKFQNIQQSISVSIYRIIQECLNNIAKHAAATKVNLSVNIDKNQINLIIKDNGNGSVLAQLNNTGGLGLILIKDRTKALNGKFQFITSIGKGFETRIWLPIQ